MGLGSGDPIQRFLCEIFCSPFHERVIDIDEDQLDSAIREAGGINILQSMNRMRGTKRPDGTEHQMTLKAARAKIAHEEAPACNASSLRSCAALRMLAWCPGISGENKW